MHTLGKHTRKWNNDFIALDLKFKSKTVYSTSFIQCNHNTSVLCECIGCVCVCVCVCVCIVVRETMLTSNLQCYYTEFIL